MKYENIQKHSNESFRRVTGVLPTTFQQMVAALKDAYHTRHVKGGRKRKLSVEDMLLATLEYYREYRSYECIAAAYGISRQNICLIVKWVEETLVKSGLFKLPGKKTLSGTDIEWEIVLVDTTETPIQKPTSGQRKYYSGKKNDIH